MIQIFGGLEVLTNLNTPDSETPGWIDYLSFLLVLSRHNSEGLCSFDFALMSKSPSRDSSYRSPSMTQKEKQPLEFDAQTRRKVGPFQAKPGKALNPPLGRRKTSQWHQPWHCPGGWFVWTWAMAAQTSQTKKTKRFAGQPMKRTEHQGNFGPSSDDHIAATQQRARKK